MPLSPGATAPEFRLTDQHGSTVSLSDFAGERAVVLVFFPFAFSGVCTSELGALQESLPRLASEGAAVLAVSCDPVFALRTFADRDGLEFPILSDFWPHGAVASAYGVHDADRGCPTRSTFVVDRWGTICWSVHNALPDARDVGEYVRVVGSLAT